MLYKNIFKKWNFKKKYLKNYKNTLLLNKVVLILK